MNAYLFSSIQSAAYGNLFECSTHEVDGSDVVFSSMSHENEVGVMDDGQSHYGRSPGRKVSVKLRVKCRLDG